MTIQFHPYDYAYYLIEGNAVLAVCRTHEEARKQAHRIKRLRKEARRGPIG